MFASRGNNEFMLAKGNNLNNGLIFTWGFLEMASWFWVYTTLREERREKARNLVESRKRDADRL